MDRGKGCRAASACRSRSKRKIPTRSICVQRRDGGYRLAVFDTQKGEARPLSRPSPASPSRPLPGREHGRRGDQAGREAHGGSACFPWRGELSAFITVAGADLSQPRWQGSEKLFFIAAGKETTRLASLSLAGNGGSACDDPRLSGLRQFSLSRRRRRNLFHLLQRPRPGDRARSTWPGCPFPPGIDRGIKHSRNAEPRPRGLASRPYRPLRDLLPRWWSPALRRAATRSRPAS